MPPIATRRISPTAIPAMPPATPLSELRREIVIGISAPPTRIANTIPKKAESNEMSQTHSGKNTTVTTIAAIVTAEITE